MPRSIIDRNEVRRLIDEERAQLVEVLPAQEFDDLHIAGALSLPLEEFDEERVRNTLDGSRPIIVYCNDYL